MNLAVNARDAMPCGGSLKIETKDCSLDPEQAGTEGVPAGRYVGLRIIDTGTGMSQDTLDHIFEPFFTTKERGKGTGLGLPAVYGIVKQSGGATTVDSKPGEGSIFMIYLPQTDRLCDRPGVDEGFQKDLNGTGKILLVEDDGELRELAANILTRNGYDVVHVPSPREAKSLFDTGKMSIDLLLTDVVMPGMSGRELARQLRKVNPGLKVLFMSGYDDTVDDGPYASTESDALLEKPFAPGTLLREVRRALSRN